MAPKLLQVRIQKYHPKIRGPCPRKFKTPNTLRIKFITHTRKRSAANIICVDNSVFFEREHQKDGKIIISEALKYLDVMTDLHDSVAAHIMSMGETKFENGKEVKRNNIKGIRVNFTWIKTFAGDEDSCEELLEETDLYGKL